MGPEIANIRAIIGLLWPTVFLAKMSILNTVASRDVTTDSYNRIIIWNTEKALSFGLIFESKLKV